MCMYLYNLVEFLQSGCEFLSIYFALLNYSDALYFINYYPQKMERRDKIEQIVRERERQRLEVHQRRWSRREEADFFRAISTFGVEYDR